MFIALDLEPWLKSPPTIVTSRSLRASAGCTAGRKSARGVGGSGSFAGSRGPEAASDASCSQGAPLEGSCSAVRLTDTLPPRGDGSMPEVCGDMGGEPMPPPPEGVRLASRSSTFSAAKCSEGKASSPLAPSAVGGWKTATASATCSAPGEPSSWSAMDARRSTATPSGFW